MTNATFKKFLADNALQLIVTAGGIVVVIVGIIVGYQIFQFDMNKRVSALETSDMTRQQSIAQQQSSLNQVLVNQAVQQANQVSNGKKLDDMSSDLKDIRQFLLESK